MEYSEIKRIVLELIDQYSVAGEEIPASYNNHSDDLHRIPHLINQALIDIRTGVLPRTAVCRFDDASGTRTGSAPDAWISHTLPGDFWRLRSGGVRKLENSGPVPTNSYQLLGRSTMLTPSGSFLVEYERYPDQLPINPSDSTVLDEDPEVLSAACTYAAAMLSARNDPDAYEALSGSYETRLSRLTLPQSAEIRPVRDVYAFHGQEACYG